MEMNETKVTVLAVDDDDMNIAIMEEILSDRYAFVTARNGEEAVAAAMAERPAVILMDVMMPVMDGYEACRRIKADWGQSEPPHIILVSAKASVEERVKGYEAGADDYLIKPFDEEELLAKIKVHMRLCKALQDLDRAKQGLVQDNQALSTILVEQSAELVESRDMIVFALANLADSRDPETGEHLLRIREYCKILSEYLRENGPYQDQIDTAFIDNIYLSSPLHDIGKVGIPDAILLKPGRLTDSEFNMMKQHTVIGADALEEVAQHGAGGGFLRMAIEIARSHHEKWDGSGYPDKRAGLDIPLAARITGVADVFDALTSVRVYKAAFTADVARSMIVKDSGTHFDPALIDAFEACFDAMCEARSKHTPEEKATNADKAA